jgi:rfaE bifunctional protein kinase chain/domain
MNTIQLEQVLKKFPQLTLLVVGDYFLDLYLDIDSTLAETSLETGLEVHQVVRTRAFPGAAGTVTSNLRALGVNVIALGVIGEDGNGYELKRALVATGVDLTHLIESRERVTPTYTKPMRDGRELNRLDIKNRTPLPRTIEDEIILRLRAIVPRVDGIIIVDQVQESNCGIITDHVREAIVTLAREQRDKIFVAESRERIGLFHDMIVQANAREARHAAGLHDLEACGAALRRNNRAAIITVGADGILVFDANGCTRAPGVHIEGEIDTVGAGDSVCAGFTAALCAGASVYEAAEMGNLVAAVTIQQIGVTGTATPAQVMAIQKLSEKETSRN